jgi:hypothetical protein
MDILFLHSIVTNFLLVGCVLSAALCVTYIARLVIQKARAQNKSLAGGEEEEFINIALCDTRFGICTHYHDSGVELLNYVRYPINGYPTLCGAEVGRDMQNQDAEATCQTCQEALAKMAREDTK